ncbi:MAG TPA: DNA alkylation repair protein, partial [Actinomycetota bacterium]
SYLAWLPIIREGALDERNYVKKAVNWALRQIGKRNEALRLAAIAEAERLVTMESTVARWIGRDALRELRSDAVIARTRGVEDA